MRVERCVVLGRGAVLERATAQVVHRGFSPAFVNARCPRAEIRLLKSSEKWSVVAVVQGHIGCDDEGTSFHGERRDRHELLCTQGHEQHILRANDAIVDCAAQ